MSARGNSSVGDRIICAFQAASAEGIKYTYSTVSRSAEIGDGDGRIY
jgi:hypothetical protein